VLLADPGHSVERWILPQGETEMLVPENVLKSVFFLGVEHEGRVKYGGTGFFVSIDSERHPDRRYVYLVTAKHNIEKAQRLPGTLKLRINTRDGAARLFDASGEWLYSGGDVAVQPSPMPYDANLDILYISTKTFATPQVVSQLSIGARDELGLVGLFITHYGQQRNLPVVRSGSIALMPGEPLMDEAGEFVGYLAEVRSIGGLSGSPVFVFVPRYRIAQADPTPWKRVALLLGLVRGHFDQRRSGNIISYTEGELEAVNMGMATVTPISEVQEVLNQKDLVKERRRRDDEEAKPHATEQDSAKTG
jgi:hypothetical protein